MILLASILFLLNFLLYYYLYPIYDFYSLTNFFLILFFTANTFRKFHKLDFKKYLANFFLIVSVPLTIQFGLSVVVMNGLDRNWKDEVVYDEIQVKHKELSDRAKKQYGDNVDIQIDESSIARRYEVPHMLINHIMMLIFTTILSILPKGLKSLL